MLFAPTSPSLNSNLSFRRWGAPLSFGFFLMIGLFNAVLFAFSFFLGLMVCSFVYVCVGLVFIFYFFGT